MSVKHQLFYHPCHKGNFSPFHLLKNHGIIVGIDLVCNMSRTTQGFLHIVRDCLLFDQVCNRSTTQYQDFKIILGYLQKMYHTFGVPKILQQDQGPELSSKVKQWRGYSSTFVVFSLKIGVPRIPQETRNRYQKNYSLSSTTKFWNVSDLMSMNQFNHVLNQDTLLNLPTIEQQDGCNSKHLLCIIWVKAYSWQMSFKRLPFYFV